MHQFSFKLSKTDSPEQIKRLSGFEIFFDVPGGESVAEALREPLSTIAKECRKASGVTTHVTDDKLAGVAIGEHFIRVRSSRLDDPGIDNDITRFATRLLESQAFRQTGITTRQIVVVGVDQKVEVASLLKRQYLAFLPEPSICDIPIDAASMKFYFKHNDVPYEVDIGPHLLKPSDVFIELLARRKGACLLTDFLSAWSQDKTILSMILNQFVPIVLFHGSN